MDDELIGIKGKNASVYSHHTGDQAIISILRIQQNVFGFRCPHQQGNHQKTKRWRVPGEFLLNGSYDEDEVFTNSEYSTILKHDKGSIGLPRPMSDYLNPKKLIGWIIRRWLSH